MKVLNTRNPLPAISSEGHIKDIVKEQIDELIQVSSQHLTFIRVSPSSVIARVLDKRFVIELYKGSPRYSTKGEEYPDFATMMMAVKEKIEDPSLKTYKQQIMLSAEVLKLLVADLPPAGVLIVDYSVERFWVEVYQL